MTIKQLHSKVSKVLSSYNKTVIGVIEYHSPEMIDLNTGQLEKGIASDGGDIEPDYSYEGYAVFKKAIGSKAKKGTPDLKLTGDFYSGFAVNKRKDYFEIYSKDDKAAELKAKYKLIFGLTDESMKQFKEIILPTIIKKIKDGLTN